MEEEEELEEGLGMLLMTGWWMSVSRKVMPLVLRVEGLKVGTWGVGRSGMMGVGAWRVWEVEEKTRDKGVWGGSSGI